MAVPTTQTQVFYDGNGSIVTPYPVPFPVLRAEDLHVDIQLTSEPDSPWSSMDGSFTVEILSESGFANIYTVTPIADLYTVRISRIVTYTQEAVYPVAGVFPAKSHEKALDKTMMAIQQVKTEVDTHNHNGVYIRFEQLASLLPEIPALTASSVAANPVGSSGPALSIPVGGGLKFQDGGLRVGGNESWEKNYYLAIRTDGLPGSGTATDPWDASTAAKIDAILGPLSTTGEKANFHWGDGVFLINPVRVHEVYPSVAGVFAPWYFRDGWHFRGNGPQRTIFRQDPSAHAVDDTTGSRIMFRWSWVPGEHVKCGSIQDCTIDGDTHDSSAPGPFVTYTAAVDVDADKFTLRNVEFINLGGRGQEMFPIIISNNIYGTDDPEERRALITIENCTSRDIYNPGGGAGILISSGDPTENLYCLVKGNRFTDMYICFNNWHNADIDGNYWWVGRANYAAVNVDTDTNRHFRITGNRMYDCGYLFGHVGCVNLGTTADVDFWVCENFHISGNYFYPREGSVNTGVRCAGACRNIIMEGNWLKKAGALIPLGLMRDDDVYPGNGVHYWSAGVGFSPSWVPPTKANEQLLCFGNRVIDDGTTPLGMEAQITGTLDVTWDITSGNNMNARAFVAEDIKISYGVCYVGPSATKVDPYANITVWADNGTKVCTEVIMPGAGIVATNLERTGAVPVKWDSRIPSGQTFQEIGPRGYGVDASILRRHITGEIEMLIANAAFSADILTPRKGITTRRGAGWPVAADVPAGTGCRWYNTSTSEVRDVHNEAETMHYGQIFSTTP